MLEIEKYCLVNCSFYRMFYYIMYAYVMCAAMWMLDSSDIQIASNLSLKWSQLNYLVSWIRGDHSRIFLNFCLTLLETRDALPLPEIGQIQLSYACTMISSCDVVVDRTTWNRRINTIILCMYHGLELQCRCWPYKNVLPLPKIEVK